MSNKGKFVDFPTAKEERFRMEDDDRIRKTLIHMTDKFNDKTRTTIRETYANPQLRNYYESIRNEELFEGGSKSGVHRKIVSFPNVDVYDYVDAVLTPLYGDDWLMDKNAMMHEVVRPWWVVKKLSDTGFNIKKKAENAWDVKIQR